MRRLGLLVLLLAAACRSQAAATAPRAPAGPEVPAPAYYESPGPVPAPLEAEWVWRHEHNTLARILLPPRVDPSVAHVRRVEDPIEIHYLRVRPAGAERRPLVFMFPILSNRPLLMYEIGSGFNRMGYDVALVMRKELDFDPVRSVEDAEAELRVMIMRGRQALDWLVQQPTVDPERIGFFGISAGAVLGASLAAADPRIKAQVLVFAGAPMADVMVDSVEGKLARSVERVVAERGWSKDRLREALRSRLRSDPIVLAPRISRESTLMFITRDDDSVPTRYQERLWEALGRPRVLRFPGGHYTGVALFLPVIVAQAQRFLGRRLGSS